MIVVHRVLRLVAITSAVHSRDSREEHSLRRCAYRMLYCNAGLDNH